MPITSIGIIAFRLSGKNAVEYLLIRRKDTLGYIDFMRGKYSVYNKDYIMNMLKQMTRDEKKRLCSEGFNKLWKEIWGNSKYSNQYKSEEAVSREKYNILTQGIRREYGHNAECVSDHEYTLESLVKESEQYETWEEPEWGFPKGRRNNQENDFDCALREFTEETGYDSQLLTYIQNVLPFEEIFLGSNYKSYKHKYFLMYMDYETTLNMGNYQTSEVSKIEWKSYEDCMACFRPYNLEKIRILTNIHRGITSRHITEV
jgi:8-oxo-dGTP pyrophosphatase MutT (NUDIX family)